MAINPPPIRVPKQFAQDAELFGYFNSLHIYLRQLWERATPSEGVSDSDSLTLATSNLSAASLVASLSEEVSMLRTEMAALYSRDVRYAAIAKELDAIRTEVASLHSTTAKTQALAKRIEGVELLCLSQ